MAARTRKIPDWERGWRAGAFGFMDEVEAPKRWLCDAMLARLARLLRAAGHDAELAPSDAPDGQLILQAEAESRVLLTRDRELVRRAGDTACFLAPERPDDQARLLAEAYGVDWLAAPFTRCLLDNATLRPATPDERASLSGAAPSVLNACPVCHRLYWPGSHVRRMRRRLEFLAGVEVGQNACSTS